ncbi:alanine/glycine:cation symporter family protein [Ihubacter sp. rT4E-8]|uniref:alanine/glycine:cation symporter family protein n=1 Tax=Ihubacter sp. rT4E-8 TaxID=3242369 RepID=UPI003CF37073
MSLRLGFPQITKLRYICSQTFGKMFVKAEAGKISPFAAACSALGSSIGASNIVGVPVAIALGGPGAIFWMWIIAIVGCCTKYVEIALCMKYRTKNENGEWVGGAFSYVKELFGGKKAGRAIAIFCAFFTMIAGIPSVASQTLSASAQVAVFGINGTVFGIIVAAIVALIVFCGIKRIASVMEKAVPIMAAIYLLGVIIILVLNAGEILPSLGSIFVYAFTPHAAADVDHPIRQAMWGVFEVGADTILVCTATALSVLTTGVWKQPGVDAGVLGQAAFHTVFGAAGDYFVAICVLLFVITTITVVIFYDERQAEFLFKTPKAGVAWRFIAIATMIIVTFGMELTVVYQHNDFFNALFIIPNMIAIIWLVPQVVKLQDEFFHTPGKYYLADMEAKRAKKETK